MATQITKDVVHAKQDLDDTIYILAFEETPFTSSLSREKADNTLVEWTTETLAEVDANNALAEGGELTDTASTTPIRLNNQTQIFRKVQTIAGTLDAVNTLGGKVSNRQKVKAGKELKRDIEKVALSAQAKSDGSGTGIRRMQGATAFITTNVVAGAKSETNFRTIMQKIFEEGGKNKKVFVTPADKATISNTFTGASTKYQDATKATVHNNVDIYRGDFGTVDIIPSVYLPTNTALFVNPEEWALRVLRKMHTVELAKTHDADRFAMITELTLQCNNERGNGKIGPTV